MFGQLDRVSRAIFLVMTLACLPAFADESSRDPLEGFNRAVFKFNDTADKYVLKPVAKGYKAITPDPLEHGITRFFGNLGEIVNVANDLLQGKFGQAANDTGRFLLNSTLGLAGFIEVADDFGLKKSEGEDFGQTLGYWGVGPGPYIVLPFLGSSTLRDAPSLYVDMLLNPVNEIDDDTTRYGLYALDFISIRAQLLDAEELISGDKYTFIREVYLQRRSFLVNDGEMIDSFGDEFDEFDGSDDYYDYQ